MFIFIYSLFWINNIFLFYLYKIKMSKSGFIVNKKKYDNDLNISLNINSLEFLKDTNILFSQIEDINSSDDDKNKDYIEKLYKMDTIICDIGNKYYNDSFDNLDINFGKYRNTLTLFNFNEIHSCPNHLEDDSLVVNKFCLDCNEILCNQCIKDCEKNRHITFEIDCITDKHLTKSINLLTKLKNFSQLLSDYLNNCKYYIEKIKNIKKIKLEELKEYQNFILQTINEEINRVFLIEKEILSYKNNYEHRKNKIIKLILELYNSNIGDSTIQSKCKKYNKLLQKNNIEIKNKISENSLNFEKNFVSETISIKKINQDLNCSKDNKILYISEELDFFDEYGNVKIVFQGNHSISFKLEIQNLNNNYQQYCINLIIENEQLKKMIHQILNKENENKNTIIYGTLIKKNDFFSLLNNNEFNYEILITKYMYK